jgi:hypothetical protein
MTDDTPLRYWIYRHGGRQTEQWRVISRTNDEAIARWIYRNLRAHAPQGGVRLVDTETTTVLEEAR